jgi:hypothetical protein
VYTAIVTAPESNANLLAGIVATPGNLAIANIGIMPSSTRTGFIEGRITESLSGDGIKNALILTDLGGAALTSDTEGNFLLPSPSGIATITVCAKGFASKVIKNYYIFSFIPTSLTISLDTAPAGTVQIEGVVRDACTGIRINNAIITANAGNVAATNDGFYSIETSPGVSTIIASADGYQYRSTTVFSTPIVNKIVDFYLTPTPNGTGLVEGKIINSSTGTPLKGVRVDSNTGSISFSRWDGTYRLYTSICASSIGAALKGFTKQVKPIIVQQGSSKRLDFVLIPVEFSFIKKDDTASSCGILE